MCLCVRGRGREVCVCAAPACIRRREEGGGGVVLCSLIKLS